MHTPNTSNQIMKTFFIIIGIIVVIALILFGVFQVLNSPDSDTQDDISITIEKEEQEDKNPLLNQSQENNLEAIGIAPESLPSEITPAMQVCFVEKLGAERAQEIADGDSPTAMDYIKAKSCLSVE